MSKSRGLGRGFDSLIPTELAIDAPVAPSNQDLVHMVPPSQIDPNPHQPRKAFNEAELEGLAASIRQHGVLQPLVVSQKEGGRYELIAGERRLRASKLANQEVVPIIIRSFGEQQKLELALIENLQRAELNPIETAVAYRQLASEFNLTLEQIGERTGQAKSTVSNIMRLLQLPAVIQQAVIEGRISEAHGRTLLGVEDKTAQSQLLERILTDHLSVRQTEEAVRLLRQPVESREGQPSAGRPAAAPASGAAQRLAQTLGQRLNLGVNVQPTAKGGKLVINYKSDEELARIAQALGLDS
jgi:ParB family chromosome partitioning protein